MAQESYPRRFYIDRSEDQAVVRSVPVRRSQPTAATHQFTPARPDGVRQPLIRRVPDARQAFSDALVASRFTPRHMSNLVRSARKRGQPTS